MMLADPWSSVAAADAQRDGKAPEAEDNVFDALLSDIMAVVSVLL